MTKWIASVAAGLFVGAAILSFGPKTTVACGHARWPNSTFGDAFGHTDGVDFTACTVPARLAWALAGVAAVGPSISLVLARDRRGRRRQRPASGYPSAMYAWENPPREVPAEQFVTQDQAAHVLEVRSTLTIGRYIAEGRLRPATLDGKAGVDVTSVREELARRNAPGWRLRAALNSAMRWFSF